MKNQRRKHSGDRLPRLERVPQEQLPNFRLTDRDREIMKAVYEYRALTTPQIEALFFTPPGKLSAKSSTRCQYRLKMLFHHGFLFRAQQPTTIMEGRKPLVYFLDERGADLVADMLDLSPMEVDWSSEDNDVTHLFLEHLLDTNDVRVAINLAAQLNDWTVKKWLDEREMKREHMKDYVQVTGPRGGKYKVAIVPDAYFVIDVGNGKLGRFFLEVDRATETVGASRLKARDWKRKVQGYVEYYTRPARGESSPYQQRYGYKAGLRILVVTTGERRLSNMKEATEDAGGKSRFWFSTQNLASDPTKILTEPIWQVAEKKSLHVLTE